MSSRTTPSLFTTLLIIVFQGQSLLALDTTEAFEKGVSDAELYSGYDSGSGNIGMETVVGAGVTDNFSLSAAHAVELHNAGNLEESVTSFGLFLTAVDTDLFDFDFFLNYGFGTPSLEVSHSVEFGLEMNFDLDRLGFFGQAFCAFEKDSSNTAFAPLGESALGVRYLMSDWAELLSAVSAIWSGSGFEQSTLALGLNMVVTDWFEIIPETGYTYLFADGQYAFHGIIGAIFTMI